MQMRDGLLPFSFNRIYMGILFRGSLVLDKPKATTQIDPTNQTLLGELKFFPKLPIKGVGIKMAFSIRSSKAKEYPIRVCPH